MKTIFGEGFFIMNEIKAKIRKIKELFGLTWKVCPYLYFSMFVTSFISIAQTLTYIFMPKYILDALIYHENWRYILFLIGAFIGIVAVIKLLDLFTKPWRNACTNRSNIDIMDYYMGLAASTLYGRFETSDYRNKLDTALSQIRGTEAVSFCVQICSALVSLALYITFITSVSPWALLISLIVVLSNTIAKIRLDRLEEETIPPFRRNARIFNYINQAFSSFESAKEVRVNNVESLMKKKYGENIKERWELDTSYTKRQFRIRMVQNTVNAIETLLLYGYTAFQVVSGAITIGSFSAYIASVYGVSNAISSAVNAWLDIELKLKFVPVYCEIRDLAEECKNVEVPWKPEEQIEIKFENVSFKYPDTENLVLENINFILPQGCKVAIVGENGAGKTTFIKLLCRLYRPTSGKITMNGVDIEKIPTETYAKMLAVVFQDFKVFSFNVIDNIVLNLDHVDEKINDAIEKSDLRRKIDTFENGVNTFVNKEFASDGVEFSGGEAQKLVLARAYYKSSPIVILDEPTAALDPVAEQHLYEHFHSIIGSNSAIFISHRLASTSFCDKIIVFSRGRIVEEGTHKELLNTDGIYSSMWNLQVELYSKKEGGCL